MKTLEQLIRAEIDRAHINDHRLTPNAGKLKGDIAVRAENLEAVLEGFRAELNGEKIRELASASGKEVAAEWGAYGLAGDDSMYMEFAEQVALRVVALITTVNASTGDGDK